MKLLLLTSLFITTLFSNNIGISSLELEDTKRTRSFDVKVIYPTNENEPKSTFAENPAFVGFKAIEEAEIKKEKYPLYILIHGTNGNWRNLTWLVKDLALNSIIITTSYPNYSSGQATPKNLIRPWHQAKDVSFLIDEIKKSDFSESLNGKIYIIGHSLGGYTSLALAGAKIDLSKFKSFCKEKDDKSCKYFKKEINNLNKQDIKNGLKDISEKRITKTIAFAPGLIELMTKSSLKKIKTKALILTAQFDKNVPIKTHIEPYKENFSNAISLKTIKDAGHFSFLQICKKEAKKILQKENASFVCEDGKNKRSRVDIHKEIVLKIKEFIKQ